MSIELTTLATGLRVVTETIPGALAVSAGAWVAVGSRDEPAELSGVSHFLEHLLFKGTATRSARGIAEAVDLVGGEMNAFTTKEATAYYVRLPAPHVGVGLEILGDVLTRPSLKDADVESERHVILEELAADEDAPDDRAHVLTFESLFPDHPLGRETAGCPDTVGRVTPDDVRSFFGRWYRPATMVVAVAGPNGHDEMVAAVERSFPFEGDAGQRPERKPPDDAVRPLAVLRRRNEQAHLVLGFRGPDRDDPDRESLDVLNHTLGGGMSSRLFEEVRERRGLAYNVFSAPSSYSDAGTLSVYAGTSASHVQEVLDVIDGELSRMIEHGLSADELNIAVGYLTGSFVLGLEDTGSRMSRIAGHVMARGYVRPVDEQIERYRAVTRDDIIRVAARVLSGPRTLTAVGPVTKKSLQARR